MDDRPGGHGPYCACPICRSWPHPERCRWVLVDLGGFRKAHHCNTHDAFKHPFACFSEGGTLACVCGVDAHRRPEAPKVEAVA